MVDVDEDEDEDEVMTAAVAQAVLPAADGEARTATAAICEAVRASHPAAEAEEAAVGAR
jgi:hypothetical protein